MSDETPVTEPIRDTGPDPAPGLRIRQTLRAPGGMRQAVLVAEILSGPLSKRRHRPQGRSASR